MQNLRTKPPYTNNPLWFDWFPQSVLNYCIVVSIFVVLIIRKVQLVQRSNYYCWKLWEFWLGEIPHAIIGGVAGCVNRVQNKGPTYAECTVEYTVYYLIIT